MVKDPSLRKEFRDLFRQDDPEWPDLLSLLEKEWAWENSNLVGRLLAQRVAVHEIPALRARFRRMQDLRNRASHVSERVDRKQATLLRHLLLQEGLISDVVRIFQKSTSR
jgi:hypothetical protein